jgi:H/ACA ribonucleoprotein complex subunit 4
MELEKIKNNKPTGELIGFSLLNIDKPAEWTSFDVVNHIRKSLNLGKAGHLGTLDPNVTGVLPIVLEKACKIQGYLMKKDKTYIGKMKLHKQITQKQLEDEMKKFIGKINQLPPRKSRVKRQVRQREVMKFKLLGFNEKTMEADFVAEVEAGTYIRKLCSDLGESLGIGTQMTELRRTKAGLFSDKDAEFATIETLNNAIDEYKNGKPDSLRKLLIPAEIITQLMPSVEVKPEFEEKLCHGSPLFDEMLVDKKGAGKIINAKEPFCVVSGSKIIEIAKFSDKFENKSILAKPETVIG